MFGFVGAHRSGKTTLARDVSEAMGIYFFESRVSETMKSKGYNMVSPDMTLVERIGAQSVLLKAYTEELEKIPRPFITDRTPVDMIAYLMAEVDMHHGLTEEEDAAVVAFTQDCMDVTRMNFDTLFCTKALSSFDSAEGKPPKSRAYQLHIEGLIQGYAIETYTGDGYVGSIIFVPEMSLRDRVSLCIQNMSARMIRIGKEKQGLLLN